MPEQIRMKIDNDAVMIAAAGLFLLIVAVSLGMIYWAWIGKFSDVKDFYTCVVTGTLLPLFTTVVTLKVGYKFLSVALNKFADKS